MEPRDVKGPPPPQPRPGVLQRRCGCDPFGELRRGLWGIGPQSVFLARVLGIVLLAVGGAIYIALAVRQYLTQTPVTQAATLVRPLPHPDLVLCLDRRALGLCVDGAATYTVFSESGPGKLGSETAPGRRRKRQEGLFGCGRPMGVSGAEWDAYMESNPGVGRRKIRLSRRSAELELEPEVVAQTERQDLPPPSPPMPDPIELRLAYPPGSGASSEVAFDATGISFSCHLFPASRAVAGGTLVGNDTRSYTVSVTAPADRTTAEPGPWQGTLWAALVHPRVTEAFFSGRIRSLGVLDAFPVQVNTIATLAWTFAIDKTVGLGSENGGGRYVQATPGGEVYLVSNQRQGLLREDFALGTFLRYADVVVVSENRPAATPGTFTVVETTSVYTFTTLDVITSVGAMMTWCAVLYRAFFGQGRLQPLGLVQMCFLRSRAARRMGELYGRGYDPSKAYAPPSPPAPAPTPPSLTPATRGTSSATLFVPDNFMPSTAFASQASISVPASARSVAARQPAAAHDAVEAWLEERASLPPSVPSAPASGKKASREEVRREMAELRAALDAGMRRIARLEAQDRMVGDLYLNRDVVGAMLAEAEAEMPPQGMA
ncbi:hypothetical protein DFJ74DRAFT_710158 [Hyaloraphidium curvatum]|nr:hypothetical protein DFJ74DRAFT_710158 [Hyaloraphidium curvatum]